MDVARNCAKSVEMILLDILLWIGRQLVVIAIMCFVAIIAFLIFASVLSFISDHLVECGIVVLILALIALGEGFGK